MKMPKVKLIILDVDGVLTDGKLIIGSDGTEYKEFNVKDGMGISLARYAGIKTAIITGRTSKAVEIRAEELKINHLYQGIHNKKDILDLLLNQENLKYNEVAFIGDDINDLGIIELVGLSFAPNDAVNYVKNKVNHVLNSNGGHGAVREMVEHILEKQNALQQILEDYLKDKCNLSQ